MNALPRGTVRPPPREIDIQAGFRARLRYVAPAVLCVAIPNAAKRSPWAAANVKREGLATGFPDCLCLWPGGGVCMIEFKSAKGRVSVNQSEWLLRLNQYGFTAAIARSVDEAVAFLRACGAPVMERVA